MSWQAWFTVGTALATLVAMATDRVRPDKAMVGALALLVLVGVVEPSRALRGFANEGMMTVALLFVVAAAIRRSGALGSISQRLLGRPRSALGAQLRLMLPVAGMSAFVNNTPLVAMLLPEVRDWARSRGIAASRLLIPLSYAAILGGVCTLIGTSTNLVVDGLLVQLGYPGMHFFEVSKIGVPMCLAGLGFIVLFGRALLPDRPHGDLPLANPRAFTGLFEVEAGGALDGKRLGDVTVPDLPALAPVEIERTGGIVPAPRADEVLRGGDRLTVSAAAAEVQALRRCPGLTPVTDHVFTRDGKGGRELVELVVSDHCPLVSRRVGQGTFRRHYDAAIVAIARHGERVVPRANLGWTLQAGDTLLLEASDDFLALHRTNPDFWVVTSHGELDTTAAWHQPFSLLVFLAMVVCATTGLLSMFQAALGAALVLLGSGVISWRQAQEDVNWTVLLMIAAALGVGAALVDTGAASGVAGAVVAVGGSSPRLAIGLIYVTTVVATEIVSHNASAAMMLPIALSVAGRLGVSYMPFAVAVMVGASCGFATPIGYQTHMMVYGPGGYRFSDFLRIGVPLGLVLAAVFIALAPVVWPL